MRSTRPASGSLGGDRVPFFLRRPYLLARDLLVDRNDPPLEKLRAIDDPRRFVWAILPHAARTFSACIALLPERAAEPAAVAYLYCRMLDTYEDLVVDAAARDSALRDFAGRFDSGPAASSQATSGPGQPGNLPGGRGPHDRVRPPRLGSATGGAGGRLQPAPSIDVNHAGDQRDAGHLLLVERHRLVDRLFVDLDPTVQGLIRDLVQDMAAGMRWSNATFAAQGGVLRDRQQLARYCRGVLGHPVRFASRLLRRHQTGEAALPPEIEENAMCVGEMIQLANVTRDIEKDLRRGIAYHPDLAGDLGADAADGDPQLLERVRRVREELLLMALRRAPAYQPLIDFLSPRRLSLARASGLLMLSFTDQYFRGCAHRAGLPPWGKRRSGTRLILAALPAVWSRRWAGRRLAGIERDFLRAAAA
jgi:phytoene/squalene synthetase